MAEFLFGFVLGGLLMFGFLAFIGWYLSYYARKVTRGED